MAWAWVTPEEACLLELTQPLSFWPSSFPLKERQSEINLFPKDLVLTSCQLYIPNLFQVDVLEDRTDQSRQTHPQHELSDYPVNPETYRFHASHTERETANLQLLCLVKTAIGEFRALVQPSYQSVLIFVFFSFHFCAYNCILSLSWGNLLPRSWDSQMSHLRRYLEILRPNISFYREQNSEMGGA